MHLTIHTNETAPPASRSLLGEIEADLGVLPNLAASLAASPALLTGFDALRRIVATTDPLRREVAGLAVGVAVGNRYGTAFHTMVLHRLGLPERDIAAIRAGQPPADATLAAVRDLATAVVVERGGVPAEVIDAAHAAGLDDAAILDVVLECAFATLVGLVDNLAGGVALDGFLQPHASEVAPQP